MPIYRLESISKTEKNTIMSKLKQHKDFTFVRKNPTHIMAYYHTKETGPVPIIIEIGRDPMTRLHRITIAHQSANNVLPTGVTVGEKVRIEDIKNACDIFIRRFEGGKDL